MKKILTLIFSVLFAVTVFADVVTMKYTGTTTTNMEADKNNAALVNLNPDTFYVAAYNNGNKTFPGLNKNGDLRLYAGYVGSDTTIGKGSTVEVYIQENINIILDSVNIHYNGTYNVGLDTILVPKKFTMQNVNTENVQVRIDAIDLYYSLINNPETHLEATNLKDNSRMYNIYGQEVDRSYKGIIIQNKKKFINY